MTSARSVLCLLSSFPVVCTFSLLSASILLRQNSMGEDTPSSVRPMLISTFPDDDGSDLFVMSVAFSRDGKTLAIGSGNDQRGVVHLWDLTTRERITSLKGHGGYVYSLAFSPDGTTLASSSFDQTVRLWQVPGGTPLHVFKPSQVSDGRPKLITCVAFSPDGKVLVAGGNQNIYYWNSSAKRETGTVAANQGPVDALAFSPDGKLLASGGLDKSVKLWDVATTQFKKTLVQHEEPVRSVAFSPDGTTVAVAPRSHRIVKVCDVQSGRAMDLECDSPFTGSVSFSPDGRTLAVGDEERVILFNVATGKRIAVFKAHASWIRQLVFSPNGKLLATADSNGAKLWNVEFLDRRH
ncbi:MAG: WD40 repeat domain-containing protein [Planctomycetes bacterium]|nr:WD40 repeat domain-containing protein [Planctomycetota bacterium]